MRLVSGAGSTAPATDDATAEGPARRLREACRANPIGSVSPRRLAELVAATSDRRIRFLGSCEGAGDSRLGGSSGGVPRLVGGGLRREKWKIQVSKKKTRTRFLLTYGAPRSNNKAAAASRESFEFKESARIRTGGIGG